MTIHNVIDRRSNSYNTLVNIVFAESWHDNVIKNADQFEIPDNTECVYELFKNITISDAIRYANKYKNPITMLMYDVTAKLK